MKKISIATILIIAVFVFYGVTVYGQSTSGATDAAARANGTPTVNKLLAVPGMQFTPQWKTNVIGYDSYSGVSTKYNSLFYATENTAKQFAQWLGGEYIPQESYTGGPYTIPVGAQVKIGTTYLNAGLLAKEFERLQNDYIRAVKNYEQNLAQNSAIIGTGSLIAPTDPLETLKTKYIKSNSVSSVTTTPITSSGGITVPQNNNTDSNSTPSQVTQLSNSSFLYINSIMKLLNKLVAEAKSKLALIQPSSLVSIPTNSSNPAQNNINTATTNNLPKQNPVQNIGNISNTIIPTAQFNTRCTGDIFKNLEAAKSCATLAETQGVSLGYKINCSASKVYFPFVDSTGRDYYITMLCSVNGQKGFGAALLAGYNPGDSGYIKYNPGWNTLKVDLSRGQ